MPITALVLVDALCFMEPPEAGMPVRMNPPVMMGRKLPVRRCVGRESYDGGGYPL